MEGPFNRFNLEVIDATYSHDEVVDIIINISAYISKKQLAEILGMTDVNLNTIIRGKTRLNSTRATALGRRVNRILIEFIRRDIEMVGNIKF